MVQKGIYFETARRRYRVRLYKGQKVVFCVYVKTHKEATAALIRGRKLVKQLPAQPTQETITEFTVKTLLDLIRHNITPILK